MRTVTFSDEKVIDLLNRKFICVWRNIRPTTQFYDSWYDRDSRIADIRPGDGEDNICAFVAGADGQILHAIQGFQTVKSFLRELEFGQAASGVAAKDRTDFYRARLRALTRRPDFEILPASGFGLYPDRRDPALFDLLDRPPTELIRRNLKALAETSIPPLGRDAYWKHAGLR